MSNVECTNECTANANCCMLTALPVGFCSRLLHCAAVVLYYCSFGWYYFMSTRWFEFDANTRENLDSAVDVLSIVVPQNWLNSQQHRASLLLILRNVTIMYNNAFISTFSRSVFDPPSSSLLNPSPNLHQYKLRVTNDAILHDYDYPQSVP